jgi:hypothetical protein
MSPILDSTVAAEEEDIIYRIFKRETMFYKDTYLVYKGDTLSLYDALYEMKCNIDEEKPFARGIGDAFDDTPLDYFCDDHHVAGNCPNCQSNWTQLDFDTLEEMTTYIMQIQPGYYPYIEIINL